jgi:hypothetical protein
MRVARDAVSSCGISSTPYPPASPVALLLLIRHAWRQGYEVPVDMRPALVGAEGIDVHPLRADLLAHRLRDAVDEPLEVEVLIHREVPGHLLAVLFGRD